MSELLIKQEVCEFCGRSVDSPNYAYHVCVKKSKPYITLAPEEPRDKSTYSKIDILMDSIEPIKTPMMVDNRCAGGCDMQYYGHDHKNNYDKIICQIKFIHCLTPLFFLELN